MELADTLAAQLTDLSGSPIVSLCVAFLAGLISVATPCVFPLIPITLASIGAGSDAPTLCRLRRSVFYLLGMALTYSALGIFSASTGAVFGSLLGNRFVVVLLSIFFTAMAAVTLGLVHLPLSARIQTLACKVSSHGLLGTFMMGSLSGVIAAPCVGPILVVILGLAAQSQHATFGAALLFTYALGFGLPFVILGTATGLLSYLPRPGRWLHGVKVVVAAGIMFVVFSLLRTSFFPNKFPGDSMIRWHSSVDAAIQDASQTATQDRVLMVDLYADWCAACKELTKETFPDPRVREALTNFVPVKVDFTNDSPESAALAKRYAVLGLPTILFLHPDGSEIPDTRIESFIAPHDFVRHLKRVLTLAAAGQPPAE